MAQTKNPPVLETQSGSENHKSNCLTNNNFTMTGNEIPDARGMLITELHIKIARLEHRINELGQHNEWLTDHYLALVNECASLYRMNGLQYAVASLDSNATHRLPESVMTDIRAALNLRAAA